MFILVSKTTVLLATILMVPVLRLLIWMFLSMVIPELSSMVCPASEGAKIIVSPEVAHKTAFRKLPGPASLALLTVLLQLKGVSVDHIGPIGLPPTFMYPLEIFRAS